MRASIAHQVSPPGDFGGWDGAVAASLFCVRRVRCDEADLALRWLAPTSASRDQGIVLSGEPVECMLDLIPVLYFPITATGGMGSRG